MRTAHRTVPPQLDWLLMAVGTVCAAGAGVVMPLFSIIFGDILDAFHGPDPTDQVRGASIALRQRMANVLVAPGHTFR